MRVVAFEREILVLEVEQVLHCGIDAHRRQFARPARELFARLFEVIKVKVGVAEGVDEIASFINAAPTFSSACRSISRLMHC